MTKPTAIYVRVSTDEQADKGYSLPSQIEACQRFAEQKGLDVVALYQDDISGTKPISSRPEGGLLQHDIESGRIKAVIVYQIDRLSRDIVDLLTSVRDWLRSGVEIYALDVGQVTSELDIVLVIKGWQGSDERQKIRERTMRGRNAKAKAGKAVGQGIAPYGYIYEKGELLVNELEAQAVRMIYDLYINGSESRRIMGYPIIAKQLTETGIPAPRGAHWSMSAVYRILTVETYCGVLHYGRKVAKGGILENRPVNEHILINVPAIVSRETWELAQSKRTYNSKFSRRKAKREYLLRGRIACGCGCKMIGTDGVYICRARVQNFIKPTECREPRVKSRLIETATWDYVMTLITSPEWFEEKLRAAQAKEFDSTRPKQKELEHVFALLEQAEKEAADVARAMTKTGGLVARKLEQQAQEIDRRYAALTTREAELEEALAFQLTNKSIENLLQFRETVAAGLQNPTFEDKQRWLEILQIGVTVTNHQAVVGCRLSNEPHSYDLDSSGGSLGFHTFSTVKHKIAQSIFLTSEPIDLA